MIWMFVQSMSLRTQRLCIILPKSLPVFPVLPHLLIIPSTKQAKPPTLCLFGNEKTTRRCGPGAALWFYVYVPRCPRNQVRSTEQKTSRRHRAMCGYRPTINTLLIKINDISSQFNYNSAMFSMPLRALLPSLPLYRAGVCPRANELKLLNPMRSNRKWGTRKAYFILLFALKYPAKKKKSRGRRNHDRWSRVCLVVS